MQRLQIQELILSNTCNTTEQNSSSSSISRSRFDVTLQVITSQIVSSGYGQTEPGGSPNLVYGVGQCHGDIPLDECPNCMYEARANLSNCFPSNGGMVFLDGCYLRIENYNLFLDTVNNTSWQRTICDNSTQKDGVKGFDATALRAIREAVDAAPDHDNSYAEIVEPIPELSSDASVTVLANCWRTLNSSLCKSYLMDAIGFVSQCLPLSEGRTLNAGCFLRYSDELFLNLRPAVFGIHRGM